MRAVFPAFPLAASFLIFLAFAARAGAVEEVIVTGHKPSADACQRIADAKFEQWAQPRLSRVQTETFADGTQKTSEKIYTDNTVYIQDGKIWNTMQLFTPQRRVESAGAVAKNMGLADCAKGESAEESGQTVTIYTYSVGGGDNPTAARIWISNKTGLPVREEMDGEAKPPGLTLISAVYAYDGDVHIPLPAELAQSARLGRSYEMVREMEWVQANGGSSPNR